MPTCIFLIYTFPLTMTNMTKTQILDFSCGKQNQHLLHPILSSTQLGWYLIFTTWLMKNALFEEEKIKL